MTPYFVSSGAGISPEELGAGGSTGTSIGAGRSARWRVRAQIDAAMARTASATVRTSGQTPCLRTRAGDVGDEWAERREKLKECLATGRILIRNAGSSMVTDGEALDRQVAKLPRIRAPALDALARVVVTLALEVHSAPGPGHGEMVYENTLCVELGLTEHSQGRLDPISWRLGVLAILTLGRRLENTT
jgi:hypothetical protein